MDLSKAFDKTYVGIEGLHCAIFNSHENFKCSQMDLYEHVPACPAKGIVPLSLDLSVSETLIP